jgi:septal ring factor EnvC (AmiA/AmiB activator)
MQVPRGNDPAPLAHPSRSRPGIAWALLSLITILAVVSMGVFFFQREDLSSRLATTEQQLRGVRAELAAGGRSTRALQGQLRGLREDLAVTVRTVDRCRASLRAMVALWNRHIEELEAAEAGSPSTLAAAHERTEAARAAAERALRQCQG